MKISLLKPVLWGLLSACILLFVYFGIVSLVSGLLFALSQFKEFWYFIVALAFGFGLQVGLYSYLRNSINYADPSGKMMAVTGTTSTAAMISCCTHYLVNLVPILGATGIATLASQYQVKLFWVGIALNLLGVGLLVQRITKFRKHEKEL